MSPEQRAEALRLFDLHAGNLLQGANAQAATARDDFVSLLRALAVQAVQAEPIGYVNRSVIEWITGPDRSSLAFVQAGINKRPDEDHTEALYAAPVAPARAGLTRDDQRSIACIARWVNDPVLSDAEVRSIVKCHPMIERALSDEMNGMPTPKEQAR